jgi:outer membrane receptor for ferrienterochelin and colicins
MTRPAPCHLLTALAGLLAALVVLDGAAATAQSVDYGSLEQLFGEPVTMSVTGSPQRVADAPANIEIVTQDDIRRSGATTIPDVLQYVTGVDVRREGIASADVGIRGYNQTSNPDLMVLVDGRQVYMVDYGRVVWPNIPVQLDEIRQIEVIKGPNSALYGFNAVSGVINIVTYDPLKDHINTATLRGGTQEYRSGSVVGTGQIGDNTGVRISFGGFGARDFVQGPLSPFDQAARLSPFDYAFHLVGRTQFTQEIGAFVDVSLADTRTAEQSPGGTFDTGTLRSASFRAGLNAETAAGLLSLSAYHSEALLSLVSVVYGQPLGFDEAQSTNMVQASDLVKLGTDHALRFGLEYRYNADSSQDFLLGTISNAVYAASAMWSWQVTPGVSLTNAVRVDYLQLHYDGQLLPASGLTQAQYDRTRLARTSFNSGLVWKATDDDTLRLLAARGVRLPSLLEYGFQTDFSGLSPVTFSGRPDLLPSIVWNAELDYDRTLPIIDSTLRTALFAQRIDDVIGNPLDTPITATPAGTPIYQSQNIGYSTAAGLELSLKGHAPSGFRWYFSYALAATTDHTVLAQAGSIPDGIVAYSRAVPRDVVIGGVGYTRDRLEFDLLGRWQSSFLDFRTMDSGLSYTPVEVADYITLNARAGYRLTDNLSVSLAAQQFNRSELIETAGPPVERRIIVSVTVRL